MAIQRTNGFRERQHINCHSHKNRHPGARCAPLARLGASGLLAIVMVVPAIAVAQATSPVLTINEEASKADIVTTALEDGITLLSRSGGNIGVLAGPEGKFMVDSGIALSKLKLSAAITALGDGQVRYLVNTHYHWDHTDGNAWLHDGGATIISTTNTATRLGRVTRVDDWNFTFQPVPAGGLPTVKLDGDKTYLFGGQAVALFPVAPAHTDGDLYVHMQPADVMFLGDLFWNGAYPFIDNQNGGSIDGMIRALEGILTRASDRSVIVPGHGPAGTRSELKEFRDMLVAIRANVATLKKQGKTLTQIIAAKPTAQYDAKFGKFVIGPDLFTKIVYDGLK